MPDVPVSFPTTYSTSSTCFSGSVIALSAEFMADLKAMRHTDERVRQDVTLTKEWPVFKEKAKWR